ncbi:MAG: sensor histidine kinase [Stenotrophobium sp.]
MTAAAPPSPALNAPEDWRVLRLLSLYRLALIAVLLVVFESGFGGLFFQQALPRLFHYACVGYALAALLLLLPMLYHTPRIGAQAHLQFGVDSFAIALLVYASGGVPNGLGILLITPALACAIPVTRRMAVVQAACATLAMFGEEIVRQSSIGFAATEFTAAGLLGLMFFATSMAANTVAARARRSEALAERVGSDLANMSRLNDSIIENMQTGVLVLDAERGVHTINAAAKRLLGLGHSGAQPLAQVAPALDEAARAWLAGGDDAQPVSVGGAAEVIPRFTRLGWGANAPILMLLEDAAALRAQAQQMKLAALGRLSASIAHEIRNPLSAITHAGQLLAESSDIHGENQRLLGMIQRHSQRIDKIVRDVLDVSRREAAIRTELPLKNWLIRTAGVYQEGFAERPRPIELLEMPDDFSVRFDPHHLQQVIFNLWDNSFEHGGAHNVMVLLSAGLTGTGRQIYLDLRDNGPGIAAQLFDRIFEPFFTTATQGTGLGLYLSRELCEYNQARLQYLPQDEGACFRILFAPENR